VDSECRPLRYLKLHFRILKDQERKERVGGVVGRPVGGTIHHHVRQRKSPARDGASLDAGKGLRPRPSSTWREQPVGQLLPVPCAWRSCGLLCACGWLAPVGPVPWFLVLDAKGRLNGENGAFSKPPVQNASLRSPGRFAGFFAGCPFSIHRAAAVPHRPLAEHGERRLAYPFTRQYIPKQSDFDTLTDEYIQHVPDQIDSRPGKRFNLDTPLNAFNRLTR
jgi:hypothetical protein